MSVSEVLLQYRSCGDSDYYFSFMILAKSSWLMICQPFVLCSKKVLRLLDSTSYAVFINLKHMATDGSSFKSLIDCYDHV